LEVTGTAGPPAIAPFLASACSVPAHLDQTPSRSPTYTPGVTFAGVRTDTITAGYGGDSRYLPSSGTLALSITKRATSVSMVCAPNPVGEGAATTCTATANDTSSGTSITPSGTVSWSASPSGGSFSPTTCTLTASGSCFVTYTGSVTGGTYTLAATYSGDTFHTPSTSFNYSLSVLRPTTTAITCTPTSVTVGSPTTCTVPVTDNGANHVTPTGAVNWGVTPSGSGAFAEADGRRTSSGQPPMSTDYDVRNG